MTRYFLNQSSYRDESAAETIVAGNFRLLALHKDTICYYQLTTVNGQVETRSHCLQDSYQAREIESRGSLQDCLVIRRQRPGAACLSHLPGTVRGSAGSSRLSEVQTGIYCHAASR